MPAFAKLEWNSSGPQMTLLRLCREADEITRRDALKTAQIQLDSLLWHVMHGEPLTRAAATRVRQTEDIRVLHAYATRTTWLTLSSAFLALPRENQQMRIDAYLDQIELVYRAMHGQDLRQNAVEAEIRNEIAS